MPGLKSVFEVVVVAVVVVTCFLEKLQLGPDPEKDKGMPMYFVGVLDFHRGFNRDITFARIGPQALHYLADR